MVLRKRGFTIRLEISRPTPIPAAKPEQFTYDVRNRIESRTWNTGDQYADSINYQYDYDGHVTQIANSYSTIINQYDDDGQLANQTQAPAGGPSVTLTYGRNADELVNSVSTGSPYQYAVQYTYTGRDQIQAILDGSGNSIASFAYDVAGNRSSRTTTGGWTSYTFDQCNRLSTQTETFPSTGGGGPTGFIPLNGNFIYPEFGFAKYTYDNIGRITETTYTSSTAPPPNNALSYNRNYGYDTFDNLNNIGIGDGLPLLPNAAFSYDPAGNRISTQLTNVFNSTTTVNYTTNNVNQYTAVGTLDPTYDQEHNLTSYNGSNFLYDWDHHLFSATNGTSDIESRYDGLGRCVSRTVNGTLTYVFYDGWNPILETNSAGAQTAARIYGAGADEIVEGFGSSGSSGVFYHQNNVGNVTGLTNSSGNLVEMYGYDEFGHTQIYNGSGKQISTSAYGNRFMFQGREYLAAVNTYDFRARAYSPDLGRFLQLDPIGFGGGNHLYRFARNNPVTGRDPIGLDYWVTLYSSDGNGTGGYDGQGSPGGAAETTPYTRGEVSDEDSWDGYGGWAAAAAGQNVGVYGMYGPQTPAGNGLPSDPPATSQELAAVTVTGEGPVPAAFSAVLNWVYNLLFESPGDLGGGNPMPPAAIVLGGFGFGGAAEEVPLIVQNAVKGRTFEAAALKALGAVKNTTKVTVPGLGSSIPDLIDEVGNFTEIKSGTGLSFTSQLQIQAEATEGSFNLIVSPETSYISGPLQQAVYGSEGTIQVFNPAAGFFTPWVAP